MLLLTITYDNDRDEIIDEINQIKEYFNSKNVIIGISESILENTHFVKIFSDGIEQNEKYITKFNLHIANIIYKIVTEEFYSKEMNGFLQDTYFFLKYDELKEIKARCLEIFQNQEAIIDEDMIYCINRKNAILEKIVECIEENKEINIKGFITFRMKELKQDLECITDKIVEKYMVEKEYNEFIKLLKYFVDIQENKIDEINIYVQSDGNYIMKDDKDKDISKELFSELSETRFTGTANLDDMLLSGLITNSPKKIIIHCVENCLNKELIETIKSVFLDRVVFCNNCNVCRRVKEKIKI